MRCLQKDPEARPESAAVLLDELSRLELSAGWTHRRAADWWKARDKDVNALKNQQSKSVPARTIAVDLEGRLYRLAKFPDEHPE